MKFEIENWSKQQRLIRNAKEKPAPMRIGAVVCPDGSNSLQRLLMDFNRGIYSLDLFPDKYPWEHQPHYDNLHLIMRFDVRPISERPFWHKAAPFNPEPSEDWKVPKFELRGSLTNSVDEAKRFVSFNRNLIKNSSAGAKFVGHLNQRIANNKQKVVDVAQHWFGGRKVGLLFLTGSLVLSTEAFYKIERQVLNYPLSKHTFSITVETPKTCNITFSEDKKNELREGTEFDAGIFKISQNLGTTTVENINDR